jgi:TolB protein
LPGIDERLTRELERLAQPVADIDAFERIVSKKARRKFVRHAGIVSLVVAVIAGTAAGTYGLTKAFRGPQAGRRVPAAQLPYTSNGKIAFTAESEGHLAIYAVNPDGSGLERLTNDPYDDFSPAWSPDGTRVAFVRDTGRNTYNQDIFVLDADGANVKNLTNTPSAIEDHPAWSPDGSTIAFYSVEEAGGPNVHGLILNPEIRLMAADGTNVRKLIHAPVSTQPVWSPDGRKVAFTSEDQSRGTISFVGSAGDDPERVLTEEPQVDPILRSDAWAPDGRQILFTRRRPLDREFPPSDVFSIAPDGSGLTQLTTDGRSADAIWSPDGSSIAFISTGLLGTASDGGQVFLMNRDGSDRRAIPGVLARGLGISWQPVPASSESPSTVASHSPSVSGGSQKCLARQSMVTGDFDGDGASDKAYISPNFCVEPGTPTEAPWTLSVDYAPGGDIWPMPECGKDVCRALGAGDLNGDGIDELAVLVGEGASTQFVEFFEVPLGAGGPQVANVGPSLGSKEFPAGLPPRFPFGGSVTHYAALGCDGRQVISETATLNADQTEWQVDRTVLHLDKDRWVVRSIESSTQAFDPDVGVGDIFEPGAPCWMDSAQS